MSFSSPGTEWMFVEGDRPALTMYSVAGIPETQRAQRSLRDSFQMVESWRWDCDGTSGDQERCAECSMPGTCKGKFRGVSPDDRVPRVG